jgi:hypothetical protein
MYLPEMEYDSFTKNQRLWVALATAPVAVVATLIVSRASLGQNFSTAEMLFMTKLCTTPLDMLGGRMW